MVETADSAAAMEEEQAVEEEEGAVVDLEVRAGFRFKCFGRPRSAFSAKARHWF
jgi:hypothetical protein